MAERRPADIAVLALAAAIVLFVTFGFRRHATANDAPESAPVVSTTGVTPAQYYRHKDDAAVYRLTPDGTYCVVSSVSQMNAFGGFGLVDVVDDSKNFLQGRHPAASATLHCGWPSGVYHVDGTVAFYLVAGEIACRLNAADKRSRSAHVVPPDSNVLESKRYAGSCSS
jgi:hypothetical protein